MDKEEELAKELNEYQKLGEKDKNIDVSTLVSETIQHYEQNLVPAKQKKWAYLLSVFLPPIGVLFAIGYYLSDKTDAKHVANVCLILTVVLVVFYWLMFKAILSSSGVDLNQLQQVNPQDLQELLQ